MSADEVVAQRWVWIIDYQTFTVHQFRAERAHGHSIVIGWLQDQAASVNLSEIWPTKAEAEQILRNAAEVNVPILERQLAGATHALRLGEDHRDADGQPVG